MSDEPKPKPKTKTMRELFDEARARAAAATPAERSKSIFGMENPFPGTVRFRDYEPSDDAALEEGSSDVVALLNGAAHAFSGGGSGTRCTSLRHVRNVRDGIQLVGGAFLGFFSPTLGRAIEAHNTALLVEMGARLGAEADPSLRCDQPLARIVLDACVTATSKRSPQTFGMITPS